MTERGITVTESNDEFFWSGVVRDARPGETIWLPDLTIDRGGRLKHDFRFRGNNTKLKGENQPVSTEDL